MIDGIILIDKKEGLTSRDEITNVSFKLHEKKVGHIGTLDPFATGLLVALVGQGTKLSQFLECLDKVYVATLKLGKRTNAQDLTGEVIEEKEVPELNKKLIEEVFKTFEGEIEQTPPMFSAIKYKGKPLYKYARKGEEIERKSRRVHIYSLNLLSFNNDEIMFSAHVSKGTYIRTLGEDIALRLNTVGHLTSLRRVKVGEYSVTDAVTSDNVSVENIIPIEKALDFMDKLYVSGEEKKKFLNGMHIEIKNKSDTLYVYDEDGIIAIYERDHKDIYRSVRGFR